MHPGLALARRRAATRAAALTGAVAIGATPARRLAPRAAGLGLGTRGGYDGARRNLREVVGWNPGLGSPDRDTIPDLPALRARSRDMLRNAPIATGAAQTKLNNIIGPGLVPEPEIDREVLGLDDDAADAWEQQAQGAVMAHLDSLRCDLEGTLTFAGLQRLAYRSRFESGDVFVLRRNVPRQGDTLGLKLQVLEADRVTSPLGTTDDATLRDGVELDDDGQPIAYHVLNRHPGDAFGAISPWVYMSPPNGAWVRVPRFGADSGEPQVLHLMPKLRPGQTRGIPELAPVVLMLKQLSRYSDSELAAAVLTSFFTVFIKTQDQGEFGEASGELSEARSQSEIDAGVRLGANDIALGQGMITQLGPNESIEIANPARPNAQFDPFVVAILRQIGVALDLPFELLIKHFTASYSASRAAILEAWRAFVTEQTLFVAQFCQPVYEWTLAECIARGILSAPGYFTDARRRAAYNGCSWHGPTMGQLNPLDEAKAIAERLGARVTTRTKEAAQLGNGSFVRLARRQAKEERLLKSLGLTVVMPLAQGMQAASDGGPTPGAPDAGAAGSPDARDAAEQADAAGARR